MYTKNAQHYIQNVPLYQYIWENSHIAEKRLPFPFFNVLNGGAHAGNDLPFQEFMIVPIGADSFQTAMQLGTKVYHSLKKIIRTQYGAAGTLCTTGHS